MVHLTGRELNADLGGAKRLADTEPVVITDRGRPRYVLLSHDAYTALSASGPGRAVALLDALNGATRDDHALRPDETGRTYLLDSTALAAIRDRTLPDDAWVHTLDHLTVAVPASALTDHTADNPWTTHVHNATWVHTRLLPAFTGRLLSLPHPLLSAPTGLPISAHVHDVAALAATSAMTVVTLDAQRARLLGALGVPAVDAASGRTLGLTSREDVEALFRDLGTTVVPTRPTPILYVAGAAALTFHFPERSTPERPRPTAVSLHARSSTRVPPISWLTRSDLHAEASRRDTDASPVHVPNLEVRVASPRRLVALTLAHGRRADVPDLAMLLRHVAITTAREAVTTMRLVFSDAPELLPDAGDAFDLAQAALDAPTHDGN